MNTYLTGKDAPIINSLLKKGAKGPDLARAVRIEKNLALDHFLHNEGDLATGLSELIIPPGSELRPSIASQLDPNTPLTISEATSTNDLPREELSNPGTFRVQAVQGSE